MDKKKLIHKIGSGSFATLAIAALCCGGTYLMCENHYEGRITELLATIEDLKKKESEARVTQRISEQMETIASEQTAISNQERERAEEQSRIADMERGKAEIERGLALEAQRKAVDAANEAQRALAVAETQERIATENMIVAQQARAHADTLYYLSLSNSLAQTSMTQSQNGENELASLLAYASWHYTTTYGGDAMKQQALYRSLLRSSGTITNLGGYVMGNIRQLQFVGNNIIAVTDYGEIFYCSNINASQEPLRLGFRISDRNYRDFISLNMEDNLLLDAEGGLSVVDLSNITAKTNLKNIQPQTMLTLPKRGIWKKMIFLNDSRTIAAISDKMVAWIDIKTMRVVGTAESSEMITAMGMQDDFLHVFTTGNKHYISTEAGQLVESNLQNFDNGNMVTAYIYNNVEQQHVLGTYNGHIFIYDNNGTKVRELIGHNGAITDLHVWDNLIGSSSYDKSVRIWNISKTNNITTSVSLDFDYWPLCFEVDQHTKMVWVGTEKGYTPSFCSSVAMNAASTRTRLSRDFTDDEWNYFIGSSVPKINFWEGSR